MTTPTANGVNVLAGAILAPRVGAWRADLDLEGEVASKVSGDIEIVIGSATWKGRAVESGAFVGRTKVRVVGGKGGLGKALPAKFYSGATAKIVVADLLREGGETLSPTSDAGKLGAVLPFWTRHAGTVSEALEVLLDDIGATWRVLADGTIWIGTETWPTATLKDLVVLTEDPKESRMTLASESPSLVPGVTFSGRKVERVEHTIESGKTRTTVAFGDGSSADPLRTAIAGLVRQETKHVDFFAVRAGKVVSQRGDGTLDLKLDDPSMPGMTKIPIAYGIPGIEAKVKPGARVHVEFADGSPKSPRAVVIDSSGLLEITVTAVTSAKVSVGPTTLELTPASAKLAAAMNEIGTGGTGVVTQATLTPFMVALNAFLASLQPFLNSPINALSAGTAAGVIAAATALQVVANLPTNYSITTKASA
jgi:hypothetical protein